MPKTEMVTLPSTQTEVYSAGEGPTLLLIQGAGAAKEAWMPIIQRISDRVSCVTFDNRGVGKAPDAPTNLTIEDLARDAADLIEHIGGPVHVAGVSLGGMTAMRLAQMRPDLVTSLTLHSTTAKRHGRGEDASAFRLRLLELDLPVDVLRRFVFLFAEGQSGLTWDIPAEVVNSEKFVKDNFIAHMHAASKHHMTVEDLQGITAPTLITVGSDDISTTPDNAKHLWRNIPNARLVTIEGGGHGMYISEPDLVATLTEGWVRRHREAS
ncbi:MAG: alpha/beta hydrolase [Salinibacterium sp.]|nr:alpha/beta hydrolase [Salinibacterium sp.]MBF0673358.1 alpha/beta hydrolase [Salinibacterium sp.]